MQFTNAGLLFDLLSDPKSLSFPPQVEPFALASFLAVDSLSNDKLERMIPFPGGMSCYLKRVILFSKAVWSIPLSF